MNRRVAMATLAGAVACSAMPAAAAKAVAPPLARTLPAIGGWYIYSHWRAPERKLFESTERGKFEFILARRVAPEEWRMYGFNVWPEQMAKVGVSHSLLTSELEGKGPEECIAWLSAKGVEFKA